MGGGNFNTVVYQQKAQEAQKTTNSGFVATQMDKEFDPRNVTKRFSKKSPFNEFRDPITVLIGLDVTGSMGQIPKDLLTGELGRLMETLKERFNRPNENLQISFAGIGDAKTDKAPLQVTHFESDNKFADQLQRIWLEGGGGGNGGESYHLLWWYAANKTQLNYVERDKRKGILITIGDEHVHPDLSAGEIQKSLDPTYEGKNISNRVLLEAAYEQYEVYHILVTDSSSCTPSVVKQWKDLLGESHVISAKKNSVATQIADIITKHRPVQKEGMENLTEEQWLKKNRENLTDEQWVEVLNYTVCPLSGKYMKNPKELGNSKRAYEKEAIEKYLQENKKAPKDPLTGKDLTFIEQALKPNLSITQLCADYKDSFENLPEERKKRLIETVLEQKKIGSKKSEVNENKNSMEPSKVSVTGMFGKSEIKNVEPSLQEKNIRAIVECPITHEIMENPVMLVETGHTFEKSELDKWFKDHNTNPVTNLPLKSKAYTPNLTVKALCDEYRSSEVKPK